MRTARGAGLPQRQRAREVARDPVGAEGRQQRGACAGPWRSKTARTKDGSPVESR